MNMYEGLNDRREDRFFKEVFIDEVYGESKKFTGRGVILDVGALAGEYSFYIYEQAKEIYAIEPEPSAFKELTENIERLKATKIKAFNLAISDKDGEGDLWLNVRGGSTLMQGPWIGKIPVKTQTLSTFLKENNIEHVDVMKIDVEGKESDIFKDTEALKKIDTIIGEHDGHHLLKEQGFEVRTSKNEIWIANKKNQ